MEVKVHFKWGLDEKTMIRRVDYDIALVRLDYPAVDKFSGKSLPTIVNI